MTYQTAIEAAPVTGPTLADAKHLALAARVVAGDRSALPTVDYTYYEAEEWEFAAQAAIDSGETEEFAFMLAYEVAHNDYLNKGEAFDTKWTDFGNWWPTVEHG